MSSRGCEVPVPFCSRGCAGSAPPTAPTVIRELGARPTGRPRPSAPRSTEFAVHPHQSQTTTQSLPSARTSVLPTHRRRHPLDRLPPTLAPPRRWCCRSLAVSFPRSREPPREAPVPPMDVWPPLPTHAHPAGGFFFFFFFLEQASGSGEAGKGPCLLAPRFRTIRVFFIICNLDSQDSVSIRITKRVALRE